MNSKIIFLRHADTQKNPDINASKWNISELGKSQSLEISSNPDFENIDLIFVSDEIKTHQTVEPLAVKLNLKLNIESSFREVVRGDKFLTKEEFELEKEKQLTDLDYPAFGGETGNDAYKRFDKKLNEILLENPNKTILIVSHGTILNIYLAKKLNKLGDIVSRWKNTGFCSYAIIVNDLVTKDF